MKDRSASVGGRVPVLSWPFVAVIRVYQWTLSPLVGRQCRYEPTCSHYGERAFRLHGPWRGLVLTVRRIGRCHPFAKGGYDPVPIPERFAKAARKAVGNASAVDAVGHR